SNQPPRIQIWSLKTASPLESRGCHSALPVTLTQSGGGGSPMAEAGHSRKGDRAMIDPPMGLVPLHIPPYRSHCQPGMSLARAAVVIRSAHRPSSQPSRAWGSGCPCRRLGLVIITSAVSHHRIIRRQVDTRTEAGMFESKVKRLLSQGK